MIERFGAPVKLDGENLYVDVPEDVVERLARATPIPVLVTVSALPPEGATKPAAFRPSLSDTEDLETAGRLTSDGWFRCTIFGAEPEEGRLYLDPWIRTGAGVSGHDFVLIEVRSDPDSREGEMPDRLRLGLETIPAARSAWEAMPDSRRKQIVGFLCGLKTHAALQQNVDQLLTSLAAGRPTEAR
jgi:hypothetical protein